MYIPTSATPKSSDKRMVTRASAITLHDLYAIMIMLYMLITINRYVYQDQTRVFQFLDELYVCMYDMQKR